MYEQNTLTWICKSYIIQINVCLLFLHSPRMQLSTRMKRQSAKRSFLAQCILFLRQQQIRCNQTLERPMRVAIHVAKIETGITVRRLAASIKNRPNGVRNHVSLRCRIVGRSTAIRKPGIRHRNAAPACQHKDDKQSAKEPMRATQ